MKLRLLAIAMMILAIAACSVLIAQSSSVTRKWTTPYDPKPDGRGARCQAYELRFSADSLTFFANPSTGTAVSMHAPLDSGQVDSVVITGLTDDSRYWFQLRSRDSAGNWSPWSNVVLEATPDHTAPIRVTDFR